MLFVLLDLLLFSEHLGVYLIGAEKVRLVKSMTVTALQSVNFGGLLPGSYVSTSDQTDLRVEVGNRLQSLFLSWGDLLQGTNNWY